MIYDGVIIRQGGHDRTGVRDRTLKALFFLECPSHVTTNFLESVPEGGHL